MPGAKPYPPVAGDATPEVAKVRLPPAAAEAEPPPRPVRVGRSGERVAPQAAHSAAAFGLGRPQRGQVIEAHHRRPAARKWSRRNRRRLNPRATTARPTVRQADVVGSARMRVQRVPAWLSFLLLVLSASSRAGAEDP